MSIDFCHYATEELYPDFSVSFVGKSEKMGLLENETGDEYGGLELRKDKTHFEMKKKLVVFHPAIAPYRVDFFNSLNKEFDAIFYFEFGDVLEQSFAQDELRGRLEFVPRFLASGLFGIKNLRTQVLSILKKEQPDVVFCSEYNILGLLLLVYKFLFNWKLSIFTICDDSKEIAESATLVKRCMRFIAVKLYSGIILTNDDVLSWYVERFQTRQKFLFFPIIQKDQDFRLLLENALPVSRILKDTYHLEGRQVLLFVGRLIDIKNLFFLLDAFALVVKRYPKSILLFVGDGDQREALERHAERNGLANHVIFAGKKQGEDLYACYNIGQIFVLPSYYERFGAVVNEALLAGCYTLCSVVAGAACLIEPRKNGDLFDPASKTDLAEKLAEGLEDCEGLRQISLKANKMGYSYDQYIISFFNQLNSIIG